MIKKLPPWRDSISRPVAPASSVAGGDNTTCPRRQGSNEDHCKKIYLSFCREEDAMPLWHAARGRNCTSETKKFGSFLSAKNIFAIFEMV
jgi:hypothetical protein